MRSVAPVLATTNQVAVVTSIAIACDIKLGGSTISVAADSKLDEEHLNTGQVEER